MSCRNAHPAGAESAVGGAALATEEVRAYLSAPERLWGGAMVRVWFR